MNTYYQYETLAFSFTADFIYEDGTPGLFFGTTVYALMHQPEPLIHETMETLKSAPFNKIRLCVFPKDYRFNHNEPEYGK